MRNGRPIRAAIFLLELPPLANCQLILDQQIELFR
jgi:hypothetical protein